MDIAYSTLSGYNTYATLFNWYVFTGARCSRDGGNRKITLRF